MAFQPGEEVLVIDGPFNEFNGTVEDVPVYTEAQQVFTLASGDALADSYTSVTLFQF